MRASRLLIVMFVGIVQSRVAGVLSVDEHPLVIRMQFGTSYIFEVAGVTAGNYEVLASHSAITPIDVSFKFVEPVAAPQPYLRRDILNTDKHLFYADESFPKRQFLEIVVTPTGVYVPGVPLPQDVQIWLRVSSCIVPGVPWRALRVVAACAVSLIVVWSLVPIITSYTYRLEQRKD